MHHGRWKSTPEFRMDVVLLSPSREIANEALQLGRGVWRRIKELDTHNCHLRKHIRPRPCILDDREHAEAIGHIDFDCDELLEYKTVISGCRKEAVAECNTLSITQEMKEVDSNLAARLELLAPGCRQLLKKSTYFIRFYFESRNKGVCMNVTTLMSAARSQSHSSVRFTQGPYRPALLFSTSAALIGTTSS
ncbi:hypothetical protein J6590_014134, partial [Homalodisca vitripennis]